MSPYILGLGALAGYFVLKPGGVLDSVQTGQNTQLDSSKPQATSAWPSWLNIGDQPATGQGQNPTQTMNAVSGAVQASANFGSNLLNYFGVYGQEASPGSVGSNGSGGAEWALPDFGGGSNNIVDFDDK